jgi:hypothetical protein
MIMIESKSISEKEIVNGDPGPCGDRDGIEIEVTERNCEW